MANNDDSTGEKKGLIVRALRATAMGAASLLFQGSAPAASPVQPIIDRARQHLTAGGSVKATTEQLVMKPSGDFGRLSAEHGSHRSHASPRSHASHYSGSGGGAAAAPASKPAPKPAPAPQFVPEREKVYRVTLKTLRMHRGTLKDEGTNWAITTRKKKVVHISKDDVKTIEDDSE